MKIKKLENGNIQVIENGKVIKSFSSTASLEFTQGGEAVGLFYNGSNIFDFYPTEVQELEVAPAPAVAFSGEVEDLLEELSLNFFFDEVEGTGGAGNFTYYNNPSVFHTLQGDISPNIGQGSQGTTLVAQLIKPSGDFVVDSISINIISGAVGVAVVGVYDLDNNGYPNNKLFQTTDFNTNITGVQSIAVTPYTLEGSTNYALVFQSSVSIPNMVRFGILGSNNSILWGTDASSLRYGLLNIVNTFSSTLPSVFPSGASLNTQPLIGIFFQ
jgi:hypothetical protein